MRRLFVLCPVVTLTLVLPVAPQTPPGATDKERLAQLVTQLGSKQYAQREQASRELDALGSDALAVLRKALKSSDLEVRRRAQALVQKIEKRLETAKLLTPRTLRLVYKETPLAQAVADFAKKSGFAIELKPGEPTLDQRKVTLDTGDTTFWKAFDQFCSAAGLVESAPPAAKKINGGGSYTSSIVIIGGNAARTPRDVLNPDGADKLRKLVLTDGKPAALPTDYRDSLRIRVLPPGTPIQGEKEVPGEVLLALEVTPEPALHWQKVIGVRLQRATDDQGQTLAQRLTLEELTPPGANNVIGRKGVVIVNGQVITPEDDRPKGNPQQIPVRLALGEEEATLLKELTGTIAAQVQGPPQTLAVVDNILKAEGQTIKGTAGSSIKVVEVSHKKNEVKLRVRVKPPPDGTDRTPQPFGQTILINGRPVGGGNEESLTAANFALLDKKGRPFQVVRALDTGLGLGSVQELELTYRPQVGQTEPVQLVFRGRRTAVIDVPFTLKNVPLP
jgi:hypothetical protein